MEKAMLADAIATACGAVCGTFTVGSYVEASGNRGIFFHEFVFNSHRFACTRLCDGSRTHLCGNYDDE